MLLMFVGELAAQTTWTGAGPTRQWHEPLNWTLGVPTAGTSALVPQIAGGVYPLVDQVATCLSLTVEQGAAVDMTTGMEVRLSGSLVMNGQSSTGTYALVGSGSVQGTGTLPDIEVRATGTYVVRPTSIAGGLRVTAGLANVATTVAGNVIVTGGQLRADGGLTVLGDFAHTGVASVSARIVFRGMNWTSNAAFHGTGSLTYVSFESAGTPTLDFTDATLARWHELTVAAGTTLVVPIGVECGLRMAVHGTLRVTGAAPIRVTDSLTISTDGRLEAASVSAVEVGAGMTVNGKALMSGAARVSAAAFLGVNAPNGEVDAPSATLETGNLFSNSGIVRLGASVAHRWGVASLQGGTFTLGSPSRITFVGNGTARVVAPHVLPDTDVDTAGTINFAGEVTGNLRVMSGGLTPNGLTVRGDATFSGGRIVGGSTVVVFGSFTYSSAQGCSGAVVDHRGTSWTSNSALHDSAEPPSVTFASGGTPSVNLTDAAAFRWQRLTVPAGTTVQTPLNVVCRSDASIAGTLLSSGTGVSAVDGNLDIRPGGRFEGAALTQLSVAGTLDVFGVLRIAAASRLVAAIRLAVTGTGAELDASSAALEAGSLSGSLSTIRLGNHQTHRLGGLSLSSTTLQLPPTSRVTLFGNGDFIMAASGSLPNVDVDGTIPLLSANVSGDLRVLNGDLRFGAAVTVQGNVSVSGGRLGTGATLTVNGNFNYTSPLTSPTPPSNIVFRGSQWSVSPTWVPTNGAVTMAGAAPQTVSATAGPPCFFDLVVANGARVTLSSDICVLRDATVQAGGQLNNQFTAEVRRDCRNAGTVDLQTVGAIAVERNLDNASGIWLNGGTLVMTGAGQVTSATTAMRNLTIRTDPGEDAEVVGAVPISGRLEIQRGRLSFPPGSVLSVTGDAAILGGGFAANQGSLDVAGNVQVVWSQPGPVVPITAPPEIRCAGNWTAQADFFAPASGTVVLDGPGETTLDSSGPTRQLNFWDLSIRNGSRVPGSDLAISNGNGGTTRIGGGGQLRTSDRPLIGPSRRTVIEDGQLVVNAGGTLRLPPGAVIEVQSAGAMRLDGRPGAPAAIVPEGAAGWRMEVAGTIGGQYCQCRGMDAAGVQILASASIAPRPADLRFAEFADAMPGGVMLAFTLGAQTPPRVLRYTTFGPSAVGSFNVRASIAGGTTATVRVSNFYGNHAGAAYEDDPLDLVTWSNPRTELAEEFRAFGRLGNIDLTFATREENDDGPFHIRVANATAGGADIPGSPFVPRGNGGPWIYSLRHPVTQPETPYVYVLSQEDPTQPNGERILGRAVASTPQPLTGITAFVGPGGYTDIAAGIAAVPSGGFVVVSPGLYPPFRVQRSVHVMGDGAGPVRVDTSLAAVVVENFAGPGDVTLADLITEGSFGIEIRSCTAPVILDGCTTTGAALAPAVLVDASRQVAIQECSFAGNPSVVASAATVQMWRATLVALTAQNSSAVQHVGSSGFQVIADGTSSVTALAGTCPWLGGPRMTFGAQDGLRDGQQLGLQVEDAAARLYFVRIAATKEWFDLSAFLPIDMVSLLALNDGITLTSGILGGDGKAQLRVAIPEDPGLWGMGLPLQALSFDPSTGRGRWSNARDCVIMPGLLQSAR